jgi:hypothetical protein
MNITTRLCLALTALLLVTAVADARTLRYSTGNGDWDTNATWSPPGPVQPDDILIIRNGDTVTVSGSKKVKSLTVNGGGTLAGNPTLDLETTGNLLNRGTITGGNLDIDVGGKLTNEGSIQGGAGAADMDGGEVVIRVAGNMANAEDADITGGQGGARGTQRVGTGGRVKIYVKKALTNDGEIKGGIGGNGGAGKGGQGGAASVSEKGGLQNGEFSGGEGGPGGEKGDPGRSHWDTRIAFEAGGTATLDGGHVGLQADGGDVKIGLLAPAAIHAKKMLILASGSLDLRGSAPSRFGPRAVVTEDVLVLAAGVLSDPWLPPSSFFSRSPTLRRRARIDALGAPVLGQTFVQQVVAPDDPGASYFCATSLSAVEGIATGDVHIPLDFDALFVQSLFGLPPFYDYRGALGGLGTGYPKIRIPALPALAGVDLYTAVLIVDHQGFRNLSPAKKVTLVSP